MPEVVRYPRVKEDEPKTKIKIRLVSGETKVLEVNTADKVEVVRKFMAQFCVGEFSMMSGNGLD